MCYDGHAHTFCQVVAALAEVPVAVYIWRVSVISCVRWATMCLLLSLNGQCERYSYSQYVRVSVIKPLKHGLPVSAMHVRLKTAST